MVINNVSTFADVLVNPYVITDIETNQENKDLVIFSTTRAIIKTDGKQFVLIAGSHDKQATSANDDNRFTEIHGFTQMAGSPHILLVLDMQTIRKANTKFNITDNVAGTWGVRGHRDGIGDQVRFSNTRRILSYQGKPGYFLIADADNCAIRLLNAGSKEVTTLHRNADHKRIFSIAFHKYMTDTIVFITTQEINALNLDNKTTWNLFTSRSSSNTSFKDILHIVDSNIFMVIDSGDNHTFIFNANKHTGRGSLTAVKLRNHEPLNSIHGGDNSNVYIGSDHRITKVSGTHDK